MNEQFIKNLLEKLDNNVKLIGVSKTRTKDEIMLAHKLGITNFGENYVQELIEKYDEKDGLVWHFIGRIQTNKIKDIVKRVDYIHGVSRVKEVKEINKQSEKINKISNILIELNLIPNDLTHGGVKEEDLEELINECLNCNNICLKGLMVIGPNSDNEKEIAKVFAKGQEIFNIYKSKIDSFTELSMGMSDDYEIALKYGSTMLRIGSKIFGPRNYNK